MSPTLRMADMQSTYERSIESDYQTRIEQLLAPIVGIENVNSDVDVVIDFSEFEATSEIFDQTGKGPLSRSETLSVDRNRENTRVGGIPGAPSNLAPANLGDPNAGEQQVPEAQTTTPAEPTSERTTRNYEIDRSIQYSRNAVGTISRLSIAVVVNQAALGLEASEESDATESTSSGVNLDQLTDLIKNSVGFDEARGDQVLIISSPFVDVAQIEEIPIPWYENSSIQFIAQVVGAVIVLALAILFVVRPAMTSILARNRELNKTSGLGAGTTQGQAFQELSYDQRVGMMRQAASSDPAKVATAIKDLVQG
jgi:flagellar M-ring protein FliF